MTKKIAIWYAMVQIEGNGTDVERPKNWAIGWNSLTKFYRIRRNPIVSGLVEMTDQICGNSTVKWLKRTNLAQSHCSLKEGILL